MDTAALILSIIALLVAAGTANRMTELSKAK